MIKYFKRLIFAFAGRPLKSEMSARWIFYSPENKKSYPVKYGRYLVCRKDGKTHMETWNGVSWAYNNDCIVYYIMLMEN